MTGLKPYLRHGVTRGAALAASVALSSLLAHSAASAEQLRYAVGLPASHNTTIMAGNLNEVASAKTNGDLTLKIFPQTLVGVAEASDGVRDGLADLAMVWVAYYMKEYPRTNYIGDLNLALLLNDTDMKGKQILAFNGAMNELLLLNCPTCIAEHSAQNQVSLGVLNSGTEDVLCTKPLTKAEDFKGMRIRSTRGAGVRLINELGGTPVNLSANDLYTGLSQGTLDCTINGIGEFKNLGVSDLVKHVLNDVPGTVYAGVASANVNRKVWDRLSTEHRAALLEGGAAVSSSILWYYYESRIAAVEEAKALGVSFVDADEALRQQVRDFAKKDIEAETARVAAGEIPEAAELRKTFEALLAKWYGLVTPIEAEADYRKLLIAEVFSKVDVATYPQQ